MIDKKFIGRELPLVEAEVEKGRLRFFAKAIGETDPIYTDETAAHAANYRSLPAPPTFAFCLEMDVPEPFAVYAEMGIDFTKVLHGEQNFSYHGPICAGDRLSFRSRIADIYAKKGGALEFIVKETTVTNQNGERVADLRFVLVVRN